MSFCRKDIYFKSFNLFKASFNTRVLLSWLVINADWKTEWQENISHYFFKSTFSLFIKCHIAPGLHWYLQRLVRERVSAECPTWSLTHGRSRADGEIWQRVKKYGRELGCMRFLLWQGNCRKIALMFDTNVSAKPERYLSATLRILLCVWLKLTSKNWACRSNSSSCSLVFG